MPKLPPAIAARRPERPSFVTILAGVVYVAAPKPDSDGYTLRRYTPDDEHDTYPA